MGNNQIVAQLKRVQEPDFPASALDELLSNLWSFDGDEVKTYSDASAVSQSSNMDKNQAFPYQSEIEWPENQDLGLKKFAAEVTVAAGYTTGEKKIEMLHSEDIKLHRVDNNERAVKYENSMQLKMATLTMLLMKRHKQGESVEDLLEWSRKQELQDAESSPKICFTKALDSIMFCSPKTIQIVLANEPDFVRSVLEGLLEQSRGVAADTKIREGEPWQNTADDLKLKQLREMLAFVVRNSADKALQTIAVRLMLRLGLIFASAQDMMMAADLQSELRLDVSWELVPILSTSEKLKTFVPANNSSDYSLSDQYTIQGRVSFPGRNDRAQDQDSACCTDSYYFFWSAGRGVYKGKMREDFTCEDCTGCAETQSIYKEVTWVVIDDKVHIRSAHLPDQPFVELDVDTCKVKEGFESWTSQDNLLNWTDSSTQSTVGNDEDGYRYFRGAQMHYLNEELWVIVPYFAKEYTSPLKRLVIEVYKRQGRHFTRTKEIPLKKEDGVTAFKGAKGRSQEYCSMGHLHKNKSIIMWSSGKSFHAFDRFSGQRISKSRETGTQHITFYNPKNNRFHRLDCTVYSSNYAFVITNYDPKAQEVQSAASQLKMPVFLDEIKANLRKLLLETNSEEVKVESEQAKQPEKRQKTRPKPALNHLAQLIGLDVAKTGQLEALPTLPSVRDVHATTKVIIYSFVNVEANYQMQQAQLKMFEPPQGAEMLKFFKAPNSVHLTRDFIMQTHDRLKSALQKHEHSPFAHIELFTLLHLIQATLWSFPCCRLVASQVLTRDQISAINSLVPLLLDVKPVAGAKGKTELTDVETSSILLSELAKSVANSILQELDEESPEVKLKHILSQVNGATPELAADLMVKLSGKQQMEKLFSQPYKLDSLLFVLNTCCFVVNQSFKRVLNAAVNEKHFSEELDTPYAQAAAVLQSAICKQLCTAFGDQSFIILQNEAVAKSQGAQDDENFRKAVTKFNNAVSAKKHLEKLVFQSFINISEHITLQMTTLSRVVENAKLPSLSEAELSSLTGALRAFFSREASMLRSALLFNLTFCCLDVDITWLDEIAEGLKNVTSAVNGAILNFKRVRLEANPDLDMNGDSLVKFLQSALRQLTYTLGFVASRLIRLERSEGDTLARLLILQGGVENRFIPELSELTKVQIEGSFKITGDMELQQLALSEPSDVKLTAEDSALLAIINNDETVRLTLEVLQEALVKKVPMCVYARLGGNEGANLSRAAFAVILKFSESVASFDSIKEVVIGCSGQAARDIVAKLKAEQAAEFEAVLKRWETASQIRKWTQQVKLETSEAAQKEAESALRTAWNEAHPSEEPLMGELTEGQKREVEVASNAKFDAKVKDTYAQVAKKAAVLVRMQVPAAWRKKQANGLASRLRSQISIKLQQQVEADKQRTIFIQRQGEKQKDGEYDWTDRLKQWKSIQKAKGAIVDLGSIGQLNSNSVTLAVLGLLQSDISVDKIMRTVEEGLVHGLRRSAGLNLIHFGMGLHGEEQVFFDMLQWFSSSLRQRKQLTAHYLDGLAGCGHNCETSIRAQFFNILHIVLLKLKLSADTETEIKLLLQCLCWNLRAEDHELLSKLNVFDFLARGHPTGLSWVKYYQGRYEEHASFDYQSETKGVSSLNLGRLLQHTIEYLQNQVLSSVLATDEQAAGAETNGLLQSQSTINEKASLTLFDQMVSAAWASIERALSLNRTYAAMHSLSPLSLARINHRQNLEGRAQKASHDRAVYADLRDQQPNVKNLATLNQELKGLRETEARKLSALINKLAAQQKKGGVDAALQNLLKDKIGAATGLRDLKQIIELVELRDLRVQLVLLNTSHDELGLPQPVPKAKEEDAKEQAVEAEEGLSETQRLCAEIRQAAKFDSKGDLYSQVPEGRTHTFHTVPLFRLVMQLEQVIGIAEKNALVNSLFQEKLHPQQLQLLFELATSAHPVVQQLVQRVFQALLRMDFPQELFESAIEASCKVDGRGNPTRLAQLLAKRGVLCFPENKFLQLLCNSVEFTCEKRCLRGNQVSFNELAAAVETGRTLRELQRRQERNSALRSLFNAQLRQALMTLETLSDAQAETVCFLTSEMRAMSHMYPGQFVRRENGALYTVLTDGESQRGKVVLYNDPKKQNMQQVIDTSSDAEWVRLFHCDQLMTPVMDLDREDSKAAAQNSVLMDMDLVGKLLQLASHSEEKGIGQLAALTVRSVTTSINRGIMHMIEALQADYVQQLVSSNLLDVLLNYFVLVSGKSTVPFDQPLRDLAQRDMQVDMLKYFASKRDETTFKASEIRFNGDCTQAVVKSWQPCYTGASSKVTFVEQLRFLKIVGVARNKDCEGSNYSPAKVLAVRPSLFSLHDVEMLRDAVSSLGSSAIFISSAEIQALSFKVVHLMSKTNYVITDDRVPLAELLTGLLAGFKSQKNDQLLQVLDGQSNQLQQLTVFAVDQTQFDSYLAWSAATSLTDAGQSDQKGSVLNEVARRVRLSGNSSSQILEQAVDTLLQMPAETSAADTIAALGQLDCLTDEEKLHFNDFKDGKAFVPAVTEEQVDEVKGQLAGKIKSMFTKEKHEHPVPDFLAMFVSALDNSSDVQTRFISTWQAPNSQFAFGVEGKQSHLTDDNTYYEEVTFAGLAPTYEQVMGELFVGYTVLNEAICRKTLITIMSSTAHQITASSQQLLNKDEMCSRLDDLVHNYHMARAHQSIAFADPAVMKSSEAIVAEVLKLFAQSPTIKTFLVDDFFKRARETIEQASKEAFQYFNDRYSPCYVATVFRQKLRLEANLDPTNLILLSRQFIEQGYIANERLPQCLEAFANLSLMYALFFLNDTKSLISLDLFDHTNFMLRQIQSNLHLFAEHTSILTRFSDHRIVRMLLEDIKEKKNESEGASILQKNHYQALYEISFILSQLVSQANEMFGLRLQLNVGIGQDTQKLMEAITALQEGSTFTSQLDKIKFKVLLDANDPQARNLGSHHETSSRRFKSQIAQCFGPYDEDKVFKVTKHSSNQYLNAASDEGSIMLDQGSFKSGSSCSSLSLKAGSTLRVNFPHKTQIVKYIGTCKTRYGNQDTFNSLANLRNWMETAAFSPVKVVAAHDHFTFVAGDGQIYGFGKHANSYYNGASKEQEGLRLCRFPDGLKASDVKKVVAGNFWRCILTHDSRYFVMGQEKYYDWGATGHSFEQFTERDANIFGNGEDKAIDLVNGYHYSAILTQAGQIYILGENVASYMIGELYREAFVGQNNSFQTKVRMPEGVRKAVQIFAATKTKTLFANLQKEDDSIRTYQIGQTDGCSWMEVQLPENVFMTKLVQARSTNVGLDNLKRLWIWGNFCEQFSTISGETDCITDRDSNKPHMVNWFADNNLNVLDFDAGVFFAVVLTQNSQGKKEFYGIGQKMNYLYDAIQSSYADWDRFGPNAKAVYGTSIYYLADIDAESVASFACSWNAVAYVMMDTSKKPVSIIPNNPEAQGLIHFYRKGDGWAFVAEAEYEAKKASLPSVCFATRHPIDDFASRTWPNLAALQQKVSFVAGTEPVYHAKYRFGLEVDEAVQTVSASEKEAFAGNLPHEMNPIIYVRTAQALAADGLVHIEPLKLTDFFQLVEDAEDGIGFDIKKARCSKAEYDRLVIQGEAQRTIMQQVTNFTREDDAQLIKEMDNKARENKVEIQNLKAKAIEPSSFCTSQQSPLMQKGEKVIKLRCKLLLKLLQSWIRVAGVFNMRKKLQAGSIASLLWKNKFLMPMSVSNALVEKAIEQIGTGYETNVEVSRRKAQVFADSGKVDHEGKFTIYGQIIQQLNRNDANMDYFRIKDTDSKCYRITFRGEGAIDAGGPFRDSLTNIAQELESSVLPLLIRSPNNRNEHGTNRDCFILDSRSTTPSHKLMFKFFGGFLGFAFLSKSPMPFNLAPWVWKQLIQEEVTLNDLEGIDAYSAQVLRDLQNYAQVLSDQDFEAGVDQNFTTVLSTGEEVPLCDDGENVKVTKANISDFVAKIIAARANEAAFQVAAVREGFMTVIQNKSEVLDLLTWEGLEARCTGEKHISVERLKSITTFPNNDASHPIIGRFWRVFEAWSDVERSAYLKFVWGRSRLPIDLTRLSRKHEVRLMTQLSATAFPQSHTCFFQLDCPDYATDELMNTRLSAAAQLCGEMDTDHNAGEDLD